MRQDLAVFIYALLLALALCAFDARAGVLTKVDILTDNQTAQIDGYVLTNNNAEDPVEGIDVLACVWLCSECVFEGMATTNTLGAFSFPSLLDDTSYRVTVINTERLVTPDAWLIMFIRR
jgi:hypothetical protein